MTSSPRRIIPRIIPLLLLAALLFAGFFWRDMRRCLKTLQAKSDVYDGSIIVAPAGWRMTAESHFSGNRLDTEVCRSNDFVDVTFSATPDERATLYCVMPMKVSMSGEFLLRIPVRLSSWDSVSLLAVGVRNGTNGYYYARKSHPSQDRRHSVELSPLKRLRFIVDNTGMRPVSESAFNADYIRVIVDGVPGAGARTRIWESVIDPDSPQSPQPILPVLKSIVRENIDSSRDGLTKYFREKPAPPGQRVRYTPEDVKHGELLVGQGMFQTLVHPAVRMPPDPDWAADPFSDANWRYRLHGFDWLRAITAEFRKSGSAASLEKATSFIKDWASDVLGVMPCDRIVWYDMSVPDRMKRMVEFFEVYRTSSSCQSDMKFLLSQGKEGSRPSWLDRLFVKSGYVTFRDRWWSAGDFNMGVHTLFLAGYNSITHKHRDDLSFTIYGYGEDWLVDAGMYKYNHMDKFQQYARSARAHNTVSIDGTDFPVSRSFVGATEITDCYSGPDAAFVEASTRAYGDVTFSRKLLFIRPNIWIVEDSLEDVSDKEHDFVQHFHFSPGKELEPMSNMLLVRGSGDSKMSLIDPCGHPAPVLIRGVTDPRVQGWFFPQYGQKTENVCADYRLRGTSARFVKVLVLEGNDPHAKKVGDISLPALVDGIPKLAPAEMAAALLTGIDMGDRR